LHEKKKKKEEKKKNNKIQRAIINKSFFVFFSSHCFFSFRIAKNKNKKTVFSIITKTILFFLDLKSDKTTRRTEASQSAEEKKPTRIPRVTASETGKAHV
jgi:hypothetical protein